MACIGRLLGLLLFEPRPCAARELAELGWSHDDFDATLAAEVEAAARATLGDDAFEQAYLAD